MTSDFFKVFLTYLPTHVRFCPYEWVLFHLVLSDFLKPTYLPKNRTSYVEDPCVCTPMTGHDPKYILWWQNFILHQNVLQRQHVSKRVAIKECILGHLLSLGVHTHLDWPTANPHIY